MELDPYFAVILIQSLRNAMQSRVSHKMPSFDAKLIYLFVFDAGWCK